MSDLVLMGPELSKTESGRAEEEALRVASRYLAYGPRSEYDVRARLKKAEFSEALAEKVIKRLRKSGQINDQMFAMDYVQARVRHKLYGPQRLRAELRRHGIDESWIDQALKQLSSDGVANRAIKLARQFWPRTEGSLPIRRNKVRDYLLRRGYSWGEAMAAIKALKLGSD